MEQLLDPGEEGSVSTLPGSFKEFDTDETAYSEIFDNLLRCSDEIDRIKGPKSLDLHLGLEPEPLGLFETTPETVSFFDELNDKSDRGGIRCLAPRRGKLRLLPSCGGVEEAPRGRTSWTRGIRLSKLHLSSALRVKPSAENLKALSQFIEEVYLHQVIVIWAGLWDESSDATRILIWPFPSIG